MFTALNLFIAKATAGIGGFLIMLGAALSGTPVVLHGTDTNLISPTSTETIVAPEKETPVPVATKPLNQPASSELVQTKNTEIAVSALETAEPATTLEIQNVKIVTTNKEGSILLISWETTKPARSRVELGDDTYESNTGIGTDHSVSISGLTAYHRYQYKITARTQDSDQIEDDISGSYTPLPNFQKYTVEKGDIVNECREFKVRDAYSKAVRGVELMISAIYERGSSAYKTIETGGDGSARLCDSPNAPVYRVMGEGIGEITL